MSVARVALVLLALPLVARAEPLPNTHVTLELRRTIGGRAARPQPGQVWTNGQRAHVRLGGEDQYYDFAANTVIVLSEGAKIAIRNPIGDDPASLFGPVQTWKRGPERTVAGHACEAWLGSSAAPKARSERCLWRGVPLFLQVDLQPMKMGKRMVPAQTRTYQATQVELDKASDADVTVPRGLEIRDAAKGGG